MAAAAGAECELGRESDGLTQPMTLMFRMVEFDRPRFARYVREHPEQWRGVHGLWNLVAEARAAGELDLPREDILFFATPHEPRSVPYEDVQRELLRQDASLPPELRERSARRESASSRARSR